MARQIALLLRRDGKVTRTWLGVYIDPIGDELAAKLGMPDARGAYIAGVVERSPASKAGIRQGDVILTFDGHAVDVKSLPWYASVAGAGRTVALRVWRGGAEQTIELVPERQPGAE
jgi:serine protease Do